MDILNFISWIASKRRVVTTAPDDALVPIGIRTNVRDDKYDTVAIKKSDLLGTSDTACVAPLGFKPGSVGPKVSFKKENYADPIKSRDVIIPGVLEITRGNNGGLYNTIFQQNYNNDGPLNTEWNTQYVDPANTSWAPLWDIQNRTYLTWYDAIETPEGDNAPPQYVGMRTIMRETTTNTYWLIIFTEWTPQGNGGGFAYDRWQIYPELYFVRPDDRYDITNKISDGVIIARRSDGGAIFNLVSENESNVGLSPENTRWNSSYNDTRAGYSGFTDLSNLESRVYSDFITALDYQVGNNVIGENLIMHDLTTDLYYKVIFDSWTSGGNGGGFSYFTTVIPQSCGITFADGTVLNTAPATQSGASCCPTIDNDGNTIIDDIGTNLLNIGPGAPHLIADFSGMAIINDHFSGRVETWIAGSGDAVLIGYTAVGSGVPTSTMTMSGSGYIWTNNDNLNGPFTIAVIKTRQGS